jgi:hypothetical protein
MRRATTASDARSPHGYNPHRGDSGKFPWHSHQMADAQASATVNGSGVRRSSAIPAVFSDRRASREFASAQARQW